jgi:hypothetical protein
MLEEARLVKVRRAGVRSVYSIDMQGFAPVREYLDEFWDAALARLSALASDNNRKRRK